MIVSEETPHSCPRCGSQSLRQDEDVLDTWFSSWLWPFSTMGWPGQTETLNHFYPTTTLATAPEILFFWVARMIMAGLYFTGKLPFHNIILHGTVRDKTGRKMSKSLGNSIDPLEIIPVYGTDALRFSMIMITASGADVYLGKDTFDIGRNFANKLWNASRFLLSNIENKVSFDCLPPLERLKTEDLWILSKLQHAIDSMNDSFEGFRFNEACHTIYDFTWHNFCDWYIEAKKADLYKPQSPQDRDDALAIAGYVLASILKLLHPVMPFITEEIWTHLREKVSFPSIIDSDTIMTASYPVKNEIYLNDDTEQFFDSVKDIIVALRTIRSENNIPPDKTGTAVIIPADRIYAERLSTQISLINQFVKLSETKVSVDAQKPGFAGSAVVRGTQVFLLFEGLIDLSVEMDRLSKEITKAANLVQSTSARLNNESFTSRAPADIVAKEREKLQGMILNLEKLKKQYEEVKKIVEN